MHNCISTTLYKIFFFKHTRIFGKLEYFLPDTTIQFSLKAVYIWKSYSKQTKGSRLYGTLTCNQLYVNSVWTVDIRHWACTMSTTDGQGHGHP